MILHNAHETELKTYTRVGPTFSSRPNMFSNRATILASIFTPEIPNLLFLGPTFKLQAW